MLFLLDAWCTGVMCFGGGIHVPPDGVVVDGLVEEPGEFAGAAPLDPSAGTIEVEGTSSSPLPAAKDRAGIESVATTTAARAVIQAERKSR
jgi:hypothetical protein